MGPKKKLPTDEQVDKNQPIEVNREKKSDDTSDAKKSSRPKRRNKGPSNIKKRESKKAKTPPRETVTLESVGDEEQLIGAATTEAGDTSDKQAETMTSEPVDAAATTKHVEVEASETSQKHKEIRSKKQIDVADQSFYATKVGDKRKRKQTKASTQPTQAADIQSEQQSTRQLEDAGDNAGKIRKKKSAIPSTQPAQAANDDDDKGAYMSSLVALVRLISSIKLTEKHLKNIKTYCPFSNLIHAIAENDLLLNACRKNETDIKAILSSFDREKGKFNFNGDYKELRKEDIQRAFGIRDGEHEIKLRGVKRPAESDFYVRRLKKAGQNLYKNYIATEILSIAGSEKKRKIKDVTRLLTLYTLLTLFVSRKGQTIAWSYVRLVLDLEELPTYDWSRHIHDILITSLKKEENINNVVGCVVVIPYWFMECFKPYKIKKRNEYKMSCIKWSIPELSRLSKQLSITQLSQTGKAKTVDVEEIADTTRDADGEEYVPETVSDVLENAFSVPSQHLDDISFTNPASQRKNPTKVTSNVIVPSKTTIAQTQTSTRIVQSKDAERLTVERNMSRDERITQLRAEVGELKSTVTRLTNANKKVGAELGDLKKKLTGLTKENEQLRLENAKVKMIEQELHMKEHQFKSKEEELMNEVRKLQSENEGLRQTRPDALHDINISTQIFQDMTLEAQEKLNQEAVQKNIENVTHTITQAYSKGHLMDDVRAAAADPERIITSVLSDINNNENEGSAVENLLVTIAEKPTESEVQENKTVETMVKLRKSQRINEREQKKGKVLRTLNDEFKNLLGPETLKYTKSRKRTPRSMFNLLTPTPTQTQDQNEQLGPIVEEEKKDEEPAVTAAEKEPTQTQTQVESEEVGPNVDEENESEELTAAQLEHIKMVESRLPKEIINKLRVIEKKDKSWTVWRMPHRIELVVTLKHIYEIRKGDELSSCLIDGYVEMLKETFKENVENKILFLQGATWSYITGGVTFEQTRRNRVNKLLSECYSSNLQKIVIPVLSNAGRGKDVEPRHWSLLVFDAATSTWCFYNSFKEAQNVKGTNMFDDIYLSDAEHVKDYVESILKKIILKRGLKDFNSQFVAKMADEVAQQSATSLDCGVFICYWMHCLANQEEIPKTISDEQLTIFKAALINNFLNTFDLQNDLQDQKDDGYQEYCPEEWEDDFNDDDL